MKKSLPPFFWRLKLSAFRIGGLRFFVLIIIFLNFYQVANAQKVIWDKTIGGSGDDNMASIQMTPDGGYIVGGTSVSDISGEKSEAKRDNPLNPFRSGDYWLVKLNPDRTKAWDKTYGGNNTDILTAVLQTTDGGYILAGTSNSWKSGDKSQDGYFAEEGYPTKDFWLVKLKADGSKVWDKTIGGTVDDNLVSIQQTKDGGFILGGSSNSGKSGEKTQASKGFTDYWIVKLKADGTKDWDKTLGGSKDDFLQAMQQTPDGGFILGGSSVSGISGDKTKAHQGGGDYWVVKLDAKGTKIWDKTLGGTKNDELSALHLAPDGGYIVGGTSNSNIGGDKTENKKDDKTEKYGKGDFWVIKLNPSGKKVWDKTIGSNLSEELKSVYPTKDGGYILAGNSNSGISGNKTESKKAAFTKEYNYDTDYWLVKLSSEGTKSWDKTIGTQADDKLISVQQTPNGNYLIGGSSNAKISDDKSEPNRDKLFYYYPTIDYWIVQLDNQIRKNQEITFPEISAKTTADAPFTLSAKTNTGLPVIFNVVAGPAIIKANKLTLTGAGEVIVKAVQAGNASYNPAVATRTFTVTLASKQQDITYGGNRADALATMLATPDGGYLMAGTSYSSRSGDKTQASSDTTDFWLVKTDQTGKKIWDKSFGGSGLDRPTTLVATPDGGYLLGGLSTSGISGQKSQANLGLADFWIIKLNAAGEKLWDKSYGGTEADNLNSILVTPTGYLLGGTSASGKSGDKTQASKGETDFWVINIDTKGKVLWDKTYGGNKADGLGTMVPTPDGYLLGGTSASSTSGDKSQTNRGRADYWIVQIDKNGTKQWDSTYGGLPVIDEEWGYTYDLASELRSIVPTPDGGFLLGGSSAAAKGAEKSVEMPPSYSNYGRILEFNYWIVKINAAGKKQWDKIYGGNVGTLFIGFEPTYDATVGKSDLSKIIPLPEGGYLLCGTSNAKGGVNKSEEYQRASNDTIYDTIEFNDYWIVKIDEQGNFLGDKTIGGYNNDKLVTALLAPNGDYVLGGTSFSLAGADKRAVNKGISDFWVVQVKDGSRPTLPAWDMRYGGYGTDNLTSIIKTQDGGYLSGGYTNSGATGDKTQISQGQNDYWIVKSDKNGKKEWDQRHGGSQDDYLQSIIQTQDGGYLLAGSSFSPQSGGKNQVSRGGRDYWIVKTDQLGNKEWDKRYGGTGEDELKKVLQLASGRYILAGTSNSPQSGDKSRASKGGQDYWVLKINPDGQKIWDRSFGGTGADILEDLALTANGDLLLGGSSASGATGDRTQGNRGASDFWVLRIDGNGEKIWDRRFGGSREEKLAVIGSTPTGNLYVAGTTASQSGGDLTYRSRGLTDYWLIELTSTGSKVWDRLFGGNLEEELRAIQVTSAGSYLLAGTSRSSIWLDKTQPSQGGSDYWVVEANRSGVVWDQRFGGSEDDELRDAVLTPDGGYLLAGRSSSGVSGDRTQPRQGSPDYWLVKAIAPKNNARVAARIITEPEPAATNLTTIQAYPNPFQNQITISFTLPETQSATVRVLDSQGKEVTTLLQAEAKANQTYQVEWQAGKQEAGMYLLQLQTPTGQKTRKLLLRK